MGSGSYRLTSYRIFEFEKTLQQSRGSWRLCRIEGLLAGQGIPDFDPLRPKHRERLMR